MSPDSLVRYFFFTVIVAVPVDPSATSLPEYVAVTVLVPVPVTLLRSAHVIVVELGPPVRRVPTTVGADSPVIVKLVTVAEASAM